MRISSFFKLVEIQTKLASLIPFLLGNCYAFYRFNRFNTINFFLMFVSLLTVDMMTTAINNYTDYRKANKTEGYNYEVHNAIVRDRLKESGVISTIIILLVIASTTGLILFLRTNMVILILGVISFIVGILYSFGPIPISRTPFGEVFSGLFMGFIITFISVYIHNYNQGIVHISYQNAMVLIMFNLKEIIYIFLVSLPAVIGIANIMLANNICDIEDDIANNRYTLPVYIGKKKSLLIYKVLYYIMFFDIILLMILGINSLLSFFVLVTFIIVYKNIKLFYEKQTKKDTFITAIQNFALSNSVYVLTISIGILLSMW